MIKALLLSLLLMIGVSTPAHADQVGMRVTFSNPCTTTDGWFINTDWRNAIQVDYHESGGKVRVIRWRAYSDPLSGARANDSSVTANGRVAGIPFRTSYGRERGSHARAWHSTWFSPYPREGYRKSIRVSVRMTLHTHLGSDDSCTTTRTITSRTV